jgi:hypothetical protein
MRQKAGGGIASLQQEELSCMPVAMCMHTALKHLL